MKCIWDRPYRHAVNGKTGVIITAAVLCLAGTTAQAQTLFGRVMQDNQAPVAAAIVTATDANGHIVRAITSAGGEYAMTVERGGEYTVRVLRVGFEPSPVHHVQMPTADSVRRDVTTSSVAISLATASTKGATSCRVHPDTNLVTYKIWQEAEKALWTTQLRTHGSQMVGQWAEYQKGFDSTGRTVTSERTLTATHRTPNIFESVPANTLSTRGIVISDNTGVAYFAPDAALLLSADFANTHCFKLAGSTNAMRDYIGVEFAPAKKQRGVHDISGTVWVHRTTGELRHITFQYTGLPDLEPDVSGGGALEFVRLPSGQWTLTSWYARLPLFNVFKRNMNSRDDDSRYARSDSLVRATQMVGGTLTELREGTTVLFQNSTVKR